MADHAAAAVAEIDEYKRHLDVVSDAEFAAILGYQRSTIAQWKKRGAIPAAAKHVIAKHIEWRKTNESARRKFSKLSASKRHFSKALVIRFLIDTLIAEDGDLEPDGLLFSAMEMDNFELAASRLLDQALAQGARDLATGYRSILAFEDFALSLAQALTSQAREDQE